MYWSRVKPWYCNLDSKSLIIWSISFSTITSGKSIVAVSIAAFITASSYSLSALLSLFSWIFLATSSFNSAIVSNSETSLANSSSNSGNSFTFISLIVTSNLAGLPFNSSLP